jgi:hypothetical protein
MSRKSATFQEFKDYTLAVARGQRKVDPSEPKVWNEASAKYEHDADQAAAASAENSHYSHSSLRERIVEHVFVGDALRQLWKRGALDVEVLRSEFDAGGYDLVLSHRKIVRHIQFKSTTASGKATRVSVNLKLAEKPSGCVIWLVVSPKELEIRAYRWLGGRPGEPLPDINNLKVAKAPKANAAGVKAEKPGHRIVPLSRFTQLESMDAVLDQLFGPLP